MRRSTWDSPSADLGSKLILEGSNIFPGPHESFRTQRLERQPLHKHNFARSNQNTTAQHSNSSVRRSSLGCQPPTPGQLAPHIASRHKQHLQTATSVPLANSRRAQQVPAVPSRHSPSGCDGPDADTRGISGSHTARTQSGLATTAEAILVDALLCGWEQHSNDGDLYPLTLALEKEGGGGADLHTLQMATTVQLDLRATNPPLPQGSPSRTKAGKPRPRRRWQQE
ncbi:hypothetical protein WJX79_006769 [Trebouxia sp. C0005]